MELTQELLKEYVSYDECTGIFTLKKKWQLKTSRGVKAVGTVLGYRDGRGHIHFSVLGKKYKAHRLAWLYVYGEWPKDQVDHINGIKSDNRIINLRVVNNSQNQCNRRVITSISGYKGVYPHRKTGKWMAQFNKIHLGVFTTPEEAALAYDKYVLEHHGEYAATNAMIYGGF
jgi:hypothetical protein